MTARGSQIAALTEAHEATERLGLKIGSFATVPRPLRPGDLLGNRFEIILRNVPEYGCNCFLFVCFSFLLHHHLTRPYAHTRARTHTFWGIKIEHADGVLLHRGFLLYPPPTYINLKNITHPILLINPIALDVLRPSMTPRHGVHQRASKGVIPAAINRVRVTTLSRPPVHFGFGFTHQYDSSRPLWVWVYSKNSDGGTLPTHRIRDESY